MKVKVLFAVAAAALIVGMIPSPASADTATVTTNLGGLTGTRTFALLTPIVAIAPATAGSTLNLSGNFQSSVTEVAYAGDATGYSVTAAVTKLVDVVTPANEILATALSLTTPGSVTSLGTAGTDTPGASGAYTSSDGGATGTAKTVWTNSGQVATNFYTDTHTGTASLGLTVPTGTTSGNYSGTLTVTLVG